MPDLSPALRSLRDVVPGLALVAAATVAAYAVTWVVPDVNPATAAVVLGALIVNLGLHRREFHGGTRFAAHRVLRIAVVLLGLQLALSQLARLGGVGLALVVVTVAITFTGTRLVGRWIGVPAPRALLVATGFAICGASAVAAMKDVADGDDDDTAVAVALVTLCGSIAIFLLPALRGPLGLDVSAFGTWTGASVHDVGQTVATASRVPGALTAAVVVKLSRVILLAPLVVGVAAVRRRRSAPDVGGSAAVADAETKRPPLLPLFVAGFLVAIVVRTLGVLPSGVLDAAASVQHVLLTGALVGLGTGIHLATLRRTAGRSLLLALISWVLVAGVAYAGVVLLGA
ncbi:MAG: YeiH family protein [Angustibacter sp.]